MWDLHAAEALMCVTHRRAEAQEGLRHRSVR